MGDELPIIIREVPMRGAPMSRNDWLARYEKHDVLRVVLPSVRVTLTPEMEDVMVPEMAAETTTVRTNKGEKEVNTGRELATGQMVPSGKQRPTGKMAVVENPGPPVTIYFSLNSGVIGFELDPNLPVDVAPETPAPEKSPAEKPPADKTPVSEGGVTKPPAKE